MEDGQGEVELVTPDSVELAPVSNHRGPGPNWGRLEKPHVRQALIRDLALREESQKALGLRYGVNQTSIREFGIRHQGEVDAANARLQEILDNKFAHLWSTRKENRIAQYEASFERVDTILNDADLRASVNTAEMVRTQHQALRAIAEEMGQLKQQVEVTGVQITYHVEGVDMSKLQ